MGSVGDAYDHSLCESFFATLECELLDRERFRTPAEARRAVFDFIEGWYNPRRRHSALGYESPLRYERLHAIGGRRGRRPRTASITRVCTLRSPACWAASAAIASIRAAMSTASAEPPGPTRQAARSVCSPVPAAISRTRCPSSIPARSSILSVIGPRSDARDAPLRRHASAASIDPYVPPLPASSRPSSTMPPTPRSASYPHHDATPMIGTNSCPWPHQFTKAAGVKGDQPLRPTSSRRRR